jgi:glycosidase
VHYRALGKLRREHSALTLGEFRFLEHDEASFVFERASAEERILVCANMGEKRAFSIPEGSTNALTGESLGTTLTLDRAEWAILLS